MVKYLKRKADEKMTEEDRQELQNLRKLKIKYKDLELKESQKNKTDNIVNSISNMAKDDNNKVDYLKPPQEKIEEDANENENENENEKENENENEKENENENEKENENENEEMEEVEEEVEEEVDEEEEGES